MQSFQDLNTYGNTPVTYGTTADYTIAFGNIQGNLSANVYEDSYTTVYKRATLDTFSDAPNDLILTLVTSNVDVFGNVLYTGSGNIQVWTTSANTVSITGIRTIADYDDAFANVRFETVGNVPNNYLLTHTVSDQQGNTESWTANLTVDINPGVTVPGALTFNEDELSNIAGFSINDPSTTGTETYTLEISTASANIGLIQYPNSTSRLTTQTLTDTKNNINSSLTGNQWVYVPAADRIANANVTYELTRVSDSRLWTGNISFVIGNTHSDYQISSKAQFGRDIIVNLTTGPYGAAFTANGNAQIRTAQSRFGGSSLFLSNTANTYVETTALDRAIMGEDSYTIEMWLRPTSNVATPVFDLGTVGNTTETRPRISFTSTGNVQFSSSGSNVDLATTTGLAPNTWSHIAVSRNVEYAQYNPTEPLVVLGNAVVGNRVSSVVLGKNTTNVPDADQRMFVCYTPAGAGNAAFANQVYQFDISAANTFTGNVLTAVSTFDASGTVPQADGMTWSPTGNIMYLGGHITGQAFNGAIARYDISGNGWDISLASFTANAVIGIEVNGIYVKPDGTRMYVGTEISNDTHIYEYSMSTAWDISTLTLIGNINIDPLLSTQTRMDGFYFNSDGTRMIVMDGDSDRFLGFDLGTAWSVNSAVLTSNPGQQQITVDGAPIGVDFIDENTVIFGGAITGRIYKCEITNTGLFVNGNRVDSMLDSNDYDANGIVRIGSTTDTAATTVSFDGYIDDVRVSRGFGYYTANFVINTAREADNFTAFLLPFDGANASNVITSNSGFAITDQRPDNIDPDIQYSVVIESSNTANALISYQGSNVAAITLTGNRAAVNAELASGNVGFRPANGFVGPSTVVTYSQTQTTDGVTQATDLPITVVYNRTLLE